MLAAFLGILLQNGGIDSKAFETAHVDVLKSYYYATLLPDERHQLVAYKLLTQPIIRRMKEKKHGTQKIQPLRLIEIVFEDKGLQKVYRINAPKKINRRNT